MNDQEQPGYTVIIHRDGRIESRSFRIPFWAWRTGVISAGVLGVLLMLGLALYLPVIRLAARVPGLRSQVARLQSDNEKIKTLAVELDSLESQYGKVREMLGADIRDTQPADTLQIEVAPRIVVQGGRGPGYYPAGPGIPAFWPLDDSGFVTRGYLDSRNTDEPHAGIDIAVPVGTVVRASGGGTVAETGSDPEYGTYVLIQHPDSYQSMYGHLSRSLVAPGDSVGAGAVIALSGNSGRSSAPHLHFEIRRSGRTLDPLTLVKEGQ